MAQIFTNIVMICKEYSLVTLAKGQGHKMTLVPMAVFLFHPLCIMYVIFLSNGKLLDSLIQSVQCQGQTTMVQGQG